MEKFDIKEILTKIEERIMNAEKNSCESAHNKKQQKTWKDRSANYSQNLQGQLTLF